MGTDNRQFTSPAIARDYIKNVAFSFEEPNDLIDFLGMCDIVQAVFVRSIIEEINYEHAMTSECAITDDCKQEIKNKMINARDNYRNAYDEAERVMKKLKVIISRLHVASN